MGQRLNQNTLILTIHQILTVFCQFKLLFKTFKFAIFVLIYYELHCQLVLYTLELQPLKAGTLRYTFCFFLLHECQFYHFKTYVLTALLIRVSVIHLGAIARSSLCLYRYSIIIITFFFIRSQKQCKVSNLQIQR